MIALIVRFQYPSRVFLLTLTVNTPSDHCTEQPAPPRPDNWIYKYALSATYKVYREMDETFSYLQNNLQFQVDKRRILTLFTTRF